LGIVIAVFVIRENAEHLFFFVLTTWTWFMLLSSLVWVPSYSSLLSTSFPSNCLGLLLSTL
jgi:hypothetical protein